MKSNRLSFTKALLKTSLQDGCYLVAALCTDYFPPSPVNILGIYIHERVLVCFLNFNGSWFHMYTFALAFVVGSLKSKSTHQNHYVITSAPF